MPQESDYFTDGIHFSAAGNELRAGLIADWLAGSGLLP
jgi:lysophospholipase L1-like esterase